jgi:hypothetical protein
VAPRRLNIVDQLLLTSPGFRVGLIIACITILGFIAMFAFGGSDPMNSHGLGPGWECDSTKGGAVTCAKDVPLPPRKRN